MCTKCDWESVLSDCEALLSDPDFEFAEDTVAGIKEWIEENHHVTEKQTTAIENISFCRD